MAQNVLTKMNLIPHHFPLQCSIQETENAMFHIDVTFFKFKVFLSYFLPPHHSGETECDTQAAE
jgi:hypothetical protein